MLAEAPHARARADEQSAKRLPAPVIAGDREEAGDEVESTWSVRWSPPTPARRRGLLAQARSASSAAEASIALERLALRQSVRSAFAGWAVAWHRHRQAADHAAELEDLAEVARARADLGETSGLAARRLSIASRRAHMMVARLVAEVGNGRGAVEALVGPLPADAVPILPPIPASPSAEHDAIRHPAVDRAARSAERERQGVALARQIVALPEIELGWKEVRAQGPTVDGPTVGLAWRIPLPSDRRDAVAKAEAELAAAEARADLEERAVAAARRAAEISFESLRRAAQDPLEDERALAAAATLRYRLGEGDVTELLETLEDLRDVAFERLDLLADVLAAHRALEWASGRPLEIEP